MSNISRDKNCDCSFPFVFLIVRQSSLYSVAALGERLVVPVVPVVLVVPVVECSYC